MRIAMYGVVWRSSIGAHVPTHVGKARIGEWRSCCNDCIVCGADTKGLRQVPFTNVNARNTFAIQGRLVRGLGASAPRRRLEEIRRSVRAACSPPGADRTGPARSRRAPRGGLLVAALSLLGLERDPRPQVKFAKVSRRRDDRVQTGLQ